MEVINIFKRLDLIDRVPEELWTEVRDIVQEAVIKIIPKKKKCKKAKWLSEEGFQIAEKRREAKGKGKKESEKVGLKLKFRKTKIMASGPITSRQIDRGPSSQGYGFSSGQVWM